MSLRSDFENEFDDDDNDPLIFYRTALQRQTKSVQSVQSPSISRKVSIVDEFWVNHGWTPTGLLCFAFRRNCTHSRRDVLNCMTGVYSEFIHCEVFIMCRGTSESRHLTPLSMYINAEVTQLSLRPRKLASGREIFYEFVWIKLTNDELDRLKTIVYDLVVLQSNRRFAKSVIFFFFCTPCYHKRDARTCAESTLQLMRYVFSMSATRYALSYTPTDVYRELIGLNRQFDGYKHMSPSSTTDETIAIIDRMVAFSANSNK